MFAIIGILLTSLSVVLFLPLIRANLSGETDAADYLNLCGCSYVRLLSEDGKSAAISVSANDSELKHFTGHIYCPNSLTLLCDYSVLIECKDGVVIKKEVWWEGCLSN